jgi:glucosamine-6-phosphate deaminase
MIDEMTARPEHSPLLHVFPDRDELGRAAARDIAAALRAALRRQDSVRVVFAAAPSQQETLTALAAEPGIDWRRVSAFHLDEYLGLAPDDPAAFGAWLSRHLFDKVPFGAVALMQPGADVDLALARYRALLAAAPVDLVCCGIGVNGHLAFNDPPAAFDEPELVQLVDLDPVCRQQQVDDGCFASLTDVPQRAMTMTIPAILAAAEIFCMVPGGHKRDAVRAAFCGEVREAVPASALQLHPRCSVYLDVDSSPHSPVSAPDPKGRS